MKEKVKIFLPEHEVDERIAEIAKKISDDYAGKEVHLICILKGSVFFTSSPFSCVKVLKLYRP